MHIINIQIHSHTHRDENYVPFLSIWKLYWCHNLQPKCRRKHCCSFVSWLKEGEWKVTFFVCFLLLKLVEFSKDTVRFEEIFCGDLQEHTVGHYYEFTRMCAVHCERNQYFTKNSLEDCLIKWEEKIQCSNAVLCH